MSSLGLTDKPVAGIDQERLGMKDYVDAMSEFVRTCQTPMTIAIQGDWGTGKTSMMNMVKENLSKGKANVETRLFNTWQFSQFQMQDDIAISLLSSFIDALGNDKNLAKSTLGLAKKLSSGLAKGATDVMLGGFGDTVQSALDQVLDNQIDEFRNVQKLKGKIEECVKKLLIDNKADRLVVFVDDLDRIYPARAVEILETIKLFMDVDRCVFVLAVDYHVVSKGLEQKFGITMDDMKGKSFFDKIIQLPFNLPVAQYKIREYMRELFKGSVEFSEESLGILVRLAEYSIGTNPRSLKRLLNATQLLNIVAGKQGKLNADAVANKEERQRILFAVLCLQLAYESAYSVILRNIGGVNADYLDGLADVDRIRDLHDVVEALKRSLPPGVEQGEHLARFVSFMSAFKDSIQLISDTGGFAVVSEAELGMLRQFLELSSITSTAALSSISSVEIRPDQAVMDDYYQNVFTREFDEIARSIDGDFHKNINGNGYCMGISCNIAGLRCVIWFSWYPNRVEVSVGGSTKYSKEFYHYFFKNVASGSFSEIEMKHLRSEDYVILEKVMFVQGDDASSALEKFKAIISSVSARLFHLLQEFHSGLMPSMSILSRYADKIAASAELVFPADSGWVVERGMLPSEPFAKLKISHGSWQGKFFINVHPEWLFLNKLYFGISKSSPGFFMGDSEKDVVALCRDTVFKDFKKFWNNEYHVFLAALPQPVFNSYAGSASQPEGQCIHKTAEEEDKAVSLIVSLLARFKDIHVELEKLAISA